MCVIMAFEDKYPTKDILEAAETTNRHGGGIAWIDNGKVKWEKGQHVKSQYIQDLIAKEKIQLPIIVHFRIATHGGVNDALCHPFAISSKNTEDLQIKGSDPEGVMFHNGIWSKYNDVAMKVLVDSKDTRLPDGDISDSRIMAWCIRFFGVNYLSLIDEKVLVLSPKGIQRFGKGWGTVDKITCSNTHFEKPKGYTTMSMYGHHDRYGYSEYGSLNSNSSITISNKEDDKDFQGSVKLKDRKDVTKKGKGKGKGKRARESKGEGETVKLSSEEYEEEYKMLLEKQVAEKQAELNRIMSGMKSNDSGLEEHEDLGTGWFDEVGVWHSYTDPDYYDDLGEMY